MNDVVIGAISARASSSPSSGHYFWSYKALGELSRESGHLQMPVIGEVGHDCDFITPVFRKSAAKSEFRFGPTGLFRLRPLKFLREIRMRQRQGFTHFYSYDGGLSELWLCLFTATFVPRLNIVFNFHWADQWNEIFDSSRSSAWAIRKSLRSLCRGKPLNLEFSAETGPFANKVSEILGTKIHTFPIFATTRPATLRPWEERDLDVLALPQRHTELAVVNEILSRLEIKGFRTAIGVKEQTWLRGTLPKDTKENREIHFLPLNEKEFGNLLSRSKTVLLPYDKKSYFTWGSSGKFNEALVFGCFPFAPEWSAIISQAGSNNLAHGIDLSDPVKAAHQIQDRINGPAPKQGQGIYIEDVAPWLKKLFPHESAHPRKPQHFAQLGGLGLVFAIYRRPISTATIRQEWGALLDRWLNGLPFAK